LLELYRNLIKSIFNTEGVYFMRFKRIAIGLTALILAPVLAYAAGNWSTLPQVGEASFCASQATFFAGQSCSQTVPAGPTVLTGSELLPADTQITGSTPPQTVTIPMPLFDAGVYSYVSGQTTALAAALVIPNNINLYILDPTTTVTALSLTMPSAPLNGQKVHITSSHTITALTVSGAAGQTVLSAPTALTVSTTGAFGYTYVWAGTPPQWYRVN
jgi:hypothetical protein